MIAPEQWYEYQKQYQKYGIDMKPQEDVEARRAERRRRVEKQAESVAVPKGGRKPVLLMVLAVTAVLILGVVLASTAAKLTYDINKAKAQNDAIAGEIGDLDVKIMSSTKISYIEGAARSELGMKSAGANNIVYISAEDVPEEGFAEIIKEKAYN